MSEIVRKPALLKTGLKIGSLKDVAVYINGGAYPEVSHVVISRKWGHPDLWIPWSLVSEVTEQQTVVDLHENLENFAVEVQDCILVNEQILDKKIIDMEDREVDVIYDVQMLYADGKLYLTHVDASRAGLLRRIRLGFLNKVLFGKKESPDLMPWQYVHIPTDLGRLSGQVRLNVQREKLKDIHPVDLADIIEELGHKERMEIFDSLDTEKAADTLEEIEPRVQREIIKSVRNDRIGEIFKSMTSAQLADLFSILPAEQTEHFIAMLEPEKARKVRAILDQRVETVASLVSHTYLAFQENITIHDAFTRFRKEARDMDVIMYIYIVDSENKLKGVIDIRELLQAEPEQTLGEIMVGNVIVVEPGDTKDDVEALFKRYHFRAIPVVDAADRIVGVIRHKDVFVN